MRQKILSAVSHPRLVEALLDVQLTPFKRPAKLTADMLSVGGLDDVVAELHTRVWLPHVAPVAVTDRLDVIPPVGVLLYGPPGCGKSLLAVELAAAISPLPPRIVKGPELKSSLWGGDETSVRSLFEDENDDEEDDNAMRVVILDEAEALLSSRSGDGAEPGGNEKHYNSVVTQFLSCMDGANVRQAEKTSGGRPRLLMLALTNRRELLDPALLRPGRFEVQLELPLPGEAGRRRILELLTARLREMGSLEPAANEDLGLLARASVGLSGADLGGIIRVAKTTVLQRVLEQGESPTGATATAPPLDTMSTADVAELATVRKADLRAALRADLTHREQRGEPCTPVAVFDAEVAVADAHGS